MSEYRQLIKNTLEFDPQILKRYVNFMNNPDEETAVEQFGKDDKYFGTCTLMATLPGLPMFGHGQVEGYHEKYGMEYRRAYWDEYPDTYLVNRHQREIFPLLHKRYLFADVENFLLYDFYTPEGHVNENIFVYSNRSGYENSLVIYHNRWADAKGWVKSSSAYLDKSQGDGVLVQRDISEGLTLQNDDKIYTIFRDQITGLEYIRNNREIHERGLYFELSAYKYHVFLDFHQIADNEWGQFAQLHHHLKGRGVPSIDEAIKEIFLQPIHYPFRELVNPGMFKWLENNLAFTSKVDEVQIQMVLSETRQKMGHLIREINKLIDCEADDHAMAEKTSTELEAVIYLPQQVKELPIKARTLLAPEDNAAYWGLLFSWLFTHNLGETISQDADAVEQSRSLIDEWLLGKIVAETWVEMELSPANSQISVDLLKILVAKQNWFERFSAKKKKAASLLELWLNDPDIQEYLRINRYEGVLWFNKEAFDRLTRGLLAVAVIGLQTSSDLSAEQVQTRTLDCYKVIRRIRKASKKSGYQVERLMEKVK